MIGQVARPMPFAARAAIGCPPHAELALSLAAEFCDVDLDRAEALFDALATPLLDDPEERPLAQLGTVGGRILDGFRTDPAELHVHRALEKGRGHALALAIIGVEAGRRAGYDLGLVGSEHVICIGHRELELPLVLDVHRRNRLADARGLPGTLQWMCAHETAAALLHVMATTAAEEGDDAMLQHAAELRAALPLE